MPPEGERLPARRYSDDEVRAIFRRATEVEVRGATAAAGDGLTLDEIEEVAREAGIDSDAVRWLALSSLPRPSASAGSRLFGGPAARRHRTLLPGRLPEERRAGLTEALERVLDRELEVEVEGDAIRWVEDHGQGLTRITLRETEGGTELEIEADRKGWLTLLGVGSGVAAAALTPLLAAVLAGLPAWPALVTLAAVGAAVAGVRLVWSPFSRRLHRTLERGAAEIVARLEGPAAHGEDGRLPPGGDAASPDSGSERS